ncbi:MAG: FtsQ-type POTRA domain-containing protein [Acidobacteria bacterium]|nr:FtsQ-type POTRA domain-containing protein [Acidobacteriota bacterium]
MPTVLKAGLAVTLGLLGYLGYRTAVSASFFKVKAVDVAGATRASREDIRAEVLRLSNAGAWQSDLEVIAKELRGMPWVRDAVVTRVLPDGLRVRVTEREPRVIARTSGGKLIWVDEDGVSLGAATPGEEDFFIRGVEEGAGESARRANRERMGVALELKAGLDKAGLSKRVSEIDVGDLSDVRVHLTAADAGTQVALGRQDYVKRFRQAITKLDEKGRVQNGQCVSYIDMTTGRNAIFGLRACAEGAAAPAPPAAAAAEDAPRETAPARQTQSAPARAARTPRPESRRARPEGATRPKTEATPQTAGASRPRRAVP